MIATFYDAGTGFPLDAMWVLFGAMLGQLPEHVLERCAGACEHNPFPFARDLARAEIERREKLS